MSASSAADASGTIASPVRGSVSSGGTSATYSPLPCCTTPLASRCVSALVRSPPTGSSTAHGAI
ncbi:MAG: hypothetical protein MUF40_06925, partial [Gemmatimonadaceae bacterium]|nr:hypothetical protein [Gemmatimonadaceae bacterium]